MFCAVFMETHLPTFILIITKNPGQPSNQQNDLWGDLTVKHVKPTCLMVQFFFCSLLEGQTTTDIIDIIDIHISQLNPHVDPHVHCSNLMFTSFCHTSTGNRYVFSWWNHHFSPPFRGEASMVAVPHVYYVLRHLEMGQGFVAGLFDVQGSHQLSKLFVVQNLGEFHGENCCNRNLAAIFWIKHGTKWLLAYIYIYKIND